MSASEPADSRISEARERIRKDIEWYEAIGGELHEDHQTVVETLRDCDSLIAALAAAEQRATEAERTSADLIADCGEPWFEWRRKCEVLLAERDVLEAALREIAEACEDTTREIAGEDLNEATGQAREP